MSPCRLGLLTATLLAAGACADSDGDSGTGPPSRDSSRSGSLPAGDIQLAYTLDLPRGAGPFPAVALVHGSGPSTRDELTPLSRLLVARGLAVLRYDKRGVGGSGGTYRGVGVANSPDMIPLLAGDAAAAVDFLSRQPDLDGERLGLVGASQAGWIIPVAATLAPRVRFAVILVGPTVSVGREIYYSELAERSELPLDDAEEALTTFTGAEGFDPLPYLDQVDVPVLWLYGLMDRSIPTRSCLAVHRTIEAEHDFALLVYDQLGHALAASVWSDVYPWLDKQLGE
jgi:dipeptidyl aminopeptidase/acylaminoacyl peptidase